MAALAFVFALPLTQTPVAAAKSAKSKLTFYAAEGKPGACGPGCSEWIAVDGKIDPEAGKRFSEFLRSLPNPRLPVIFNSPGGRILASEAIGDLLRKNGMAAAVEKTVRVSKRARQRPQYRIVFRGARCNSACVSSFIGATRRDVAPGARIGVHASRPLEPSKLELVKEQERHYVVRMGIDAALIDTASKSLSIRNLSRNELYRYGILLSKEPFDTPWRFIKRRIHSFVVKSLTRMDEAAHHTIYIEFRCKKRGNVHLSIQRDLSDRELGSRSIMMLSWSGGRLWGGQRQAHDVTLIPGSLSSITCWKRQLIEVWHYVRSLPKRGKYAGSGTHRFQPTAFTMRSFQCLLGAATFCPNDVAAPPASVH